MPRVLIINPSALVEIVHGLQVVTSMKAQWPAEKEPLQVDWIVRDIFAPLVDACSAVDRSYVFKRHGGTMEFLRLMKEVRAVRYDYLFDFQGLLRTGLMTWQAHAKQKIGRANAREGAATFYDSKIALPPGGRRSNKLEVLLQFLTPLGLKPELAGKLDFRRTEKLKLSFVEGKRGSRIILMFPDARHQNKNWQGFKQLTRIILEKHRDCRVIWAGDTPLADKGSFPAERFLNITGTTSLLSLPTLVQKAEWVISNDTGPLHLAAALGVRTLGIFGPSDWQMHGPYPVDAPGNHIVLAPVGNLSLLQAKEVYARFAQYAG